MIFALLVVLPLQGTAATLVPITCLSAPEHAATTHAGAADTHEHAERSGANPHHQGKNGDESTGGQNYGGSHLCHLFSAMPPAEVAVAAADLPVFRSSVVLPPALFVPEQPQRPPRA